MFTGEQPSFAVAIVKPSFYQQAESKGFVPQETIKNTEKEGRKLTMKLTKRKGKLCLVIDTRPSKRIRKAKKRIRKRQLEIHDHFRKGVNEKW